MAKVQFLNNEFDSEHEAICAALFNEYGWRWEKAKRPMDGWIPDFLLKGDILVWVECKGGLRWDDVPAFPDLVKYENAVSGTSDEVLLIPEAPRVMKNARGYPSSMLGFLYDGDVWSYAELGRWSGKAGFCHTGNNWKDRMSGEYVSRSMGDGRAPSIDVDWRSATYIARGEKRRPFFKESPDSEPKVWGPSS